MKKNTKPLSIDVPHFEGSRNRFWDYHCHRCNQTGSCPIPYGMSMLNAIALIRDGHSGFNPECHAAHQGRWIEIIGMMDYNVE